MMKQISANAAAGQTGARRPQNPDQAAEERFTPLLLHAISRVAELERALATSQLQLKAARQQVETLLENRTSLRQRLIRLAKKCAQARHFAYHDELTGLPNRSLLLDRLKQAMARSERQNKMLALLFIDLNRFKNVNDKFGHAAGDNLLQQVAERLAAGIRCGDTVCRYGGDEFVIMLPEIDGEENVAAVTEKIRDRLSASYVVDGNIIDLTASIGVAVYATGGQSCSDLIDQADCAMYVAKGRSPFLSERFSRSQEPAFNPRDGAD